MVKISEKHWFLNRAKELFSTTIQPLVNLVMTERSIQKCQLYVLDALIVI